MIAAVFDLDGTLLPHTTAERLFIRYLIRNRALGPRALFDTVRFALTARRGNRLLQIKANRPYFTGLPVPRMWLLGRRCFDEVIRERLSLRGLRQLAEHHRLGHQTVLLTGSLPFVAEPMKDEFQIDDVISSTLEERDQRLTGRIASLHPYGQAKSDLIVRLAGERCIDLSQSYCYADHHTDEGMLRMFGHPVCVNPTARLRASARRAGWSVEIFE